MNGPSKSTPKTWGGLRIYHGDYYPFGLTMSGISSKALNNAPDNKKKFNEGTERNVDFDLNWDETDCRTYDPQIGRFLQIDPFAEISDHLSPFVYASNNPILRNDPYGLKDSTVNGEHVNTAATLDEVVVYGKKPNPQNAQQPASNTAGATPIPAHQYFKYQIYRGSSRPHRLLSAENTPHHTANPR